MHEEPAPYRPDAVPRDLDVSLRGLRCRVHCWGDPSRPVLLLLHGWVDTGMSFQFLADHMARDFHVVAPDWRGFGDSEWAPGGYWFPDYLADLDALLDHFSPGAPARVVGHSMGGNVAWLYAGTQPQRVSHVVSLDAVGLDDTDPADAPGRYRRWLEQLRSPAAFAPVADEAAAQALARRLAPGLSADRAAWIAATWVRPDGRKGFRLPHDPRHKVVNPVLYRRAEARACWRSITARTLLVLGSESSTGRRWEDGLRAQVLDCLPALEVQWIRGGHMLHLEQPGALAAILGRFLSAS